MIRDYDEGVYSDVAFQDDAMKRNMKQKIIDLSKKYSIVSKLTRYWVKLWFIY